MIKNVNCLIVKTFHTHFHNTHFFITVYIQNDNVMHVSYTKEKFKLLVFISQNIETNNTALILNIDLEVRHILQSKNCNVVQ